MHNKIALLEKLKILKGPLYIQVKLKRIEIARDLFMIDVETGREVFIRKSLSQQDLPMSYRYYDSIFNFIQNRMSFDRR